jgi:uncharacterized repeat protein (TIGR02543 family)
MIHVVGFLFTTWKRKLCINRGGRRMSRITKTLLSSFLAVVLMISVAFVPGLFNFSFVQAEQQLQVQVNFAGDNNLVASVTPSADWEDVELASSSYAILESKDGTVTIEFSNWNLRGKGQSEITVKLTATGVVLKNIVLSYTQSQGSGGDFVVNSGDEVTIVGNNLNFLRFYYDVYAVHALTYVSNMDGITYPSESFIEGDAITAPEPTAEGFTFLGWFIDAELTTLFTSFGSMPDNSVTVYGGWEADDEDPELFTLNYVSNMEGVTFSSETFEEGDAITAPEPTAEGFTFLGWFIDAELTTLFTSFGSMPANDVTVYGDWEADDEDPELFTLNYVSNMEGVTFSSETFEEGDAITAPEPTAEGFTFLGWFIDAELTTLFTSFGSMPANDVTVYGDWEADDEDPELFTLNYVSNMEGVTFSSETFEEGDAITAPEPTAEGFTFLGWFIDAELTTLFTSFGSMPANDVTVYGDWVEDVAQVESFTLTFVTNMEGLAYPDVTFTEGESIIAPIPSMEGFTFLGWFIDEDFIEEFDSFSSMPADNVTVYADWGVVLGDEDEFVDDNDEEEEIVDDEEEEIVDDEEKDEVLGDSDQLPETSDSSSRNLGLIFLIIGLIAITLTKKEENELS